MRRKRKRNRGAEGRGGGRGGGEGREEQAPRPLRESRPARSQRLSSRTESPSFYRIVLHAAVILIIEPLEPLQELEVVHRPAFEQPVYIHLGEIHAASMPGIALR